MKKIIPAVLLTLICASPCVAQQDDSYFSCIVSYVDVKPKRYKDLKGAPVKEIGRFEVNEIGEEETITRAFRFPHSKWFIVASLFATDESMASGSGGDSLMLTLELSPSGKKTRNVLNSPYTSWAEVPLGSFDVARLDMFVNIKGGRKLLEMECKKMKRH